MTGAGDDTLRFLPNRCGGPVSVGCNDDDCDDDAVCDDDDDGASCDGETVNMVDGLSVGNRLCRVQLFNCKSLASNI